MSALHTSVARAIADAIAESGRIPREAGTLSTDGALRAEHQARLAAAAAVRVVLAEAQRSVEAHHAPLGSRTATQSFNHGIDVALGVIEALAEDEL